MANKRQIKKRVQYVCGQMAAEILLAQMIVKGLEADAVNTIVCNIAALQSTTISHVGVAFDKVPRDFDNRSLYLKARRAYFRAAFRHLKEEFTANATELLKQMNAAVPADQHKLLASLG